MKVVAWAGGWLIFFLLLALLARTSVGHRLIVYALYLILVLLLVLHYKSITALINPQGG